MVHMGRTKKQTREYMREYMARRRQQFRDDMETLGTPVVMGRPPKEKPVLANTKRTEDIRRAMELAADWLASRKGVRRLTWREFKREVTRWYGVVMPSEFQVDSPIGKLTKKRKVKPPTEIELQLVFERVLAAENWLLPPKQYSRRGNPLVVRLPKYEPLPSINS